MNRAEIKKKLSIGTIGLWVFFIITGVSILVLALSVFDNFEFWMPIPITIVFIFAIIGTVLDIKGKRETKFGIIGVWAVFAIVAIVMLILLIGNVFVPSDYWIPPIPIGSTFIVALLFTIADYTTTDISYCTKCGKKIGKKWEFCQECGMRVLIVCPSCNTKVKGNPKFCHKCGVNLTEIEITEVTPVHTKYKVGDVSHFCQHCGSTINPEAKYCVYCGIAQE
jgi:hypothetical protein